MGIMDTPTPSVGLHTIGAVFKGVISGPEKEVQQMDTQGALKFWDSPTNLQPKTQWFVPMVSVVDAECANPYCAWEHPCKNATTKDRGLFLDGSKKNDSSKLGAVIAAVRASGASGLEVGGTLVLKYVADDKDRQAKGQSAPKCYKAVYQPPTAASLAFLQSAGAQAVVVDGTEKSEEKSLSEGLDDLLAPIPAASGIPENKPKSTQSDDKSEQPAVFDFDTVLDQL